MLIQPSHKRMKHHELEQPQDPSKKPKTQQKLRTLQLYQESNPITSHTQNIVQTIPSRTPIVTPKYCLKLTLSDLKFCSYLILAKPNRSTKYSSNPFDQIPAIKFWYFTLLSELGTQKEATKKFSNSAYIQFHSNSKQKLYISCFPLKSLLDPCHAVHIVAIPESTIAAPNSTNIVLN